jgi:glucose-1-phosphate thymidylyltransferase
MKGVILAGGLATRLYPLTFATNKHLLPIYDKPMIYYPIQTLVKSGIKEIMVIVSGPHAGHFIPVLKNGHEFGVKHLEFAYQERPNGGIADALSLAEDFADEKPITVILGDNTTDANIKDTVANFQQGAMIFLKKVNDPQRFGVPIFDPNDPQKIIKIVEKPQQPPNNYAVTGLYIYDQDVFKYIKQCQPSARGELEITDVNNFYVQKNQLYWAELNGFWSDAGTFDSLLAANNYWANKKKINNL